MGSFKRRSASLGAVACGIALLVACAGTYIGKAYQAAGVLIAANEQVQDECNRSKLQGRILAASEPDPLKAEQIRLKGLPPFTRSTCKNLAVAYKVAAEGAKQALKITGQAEDSGNYRSNPHVI